MRRPRKAINAAVFATPVGIDRLFEADVGAVVAGDDALGGFEVNLGLEGRKVAQARPAIVEGLPRLTFKAPDAVGAGAAAAASLRSDEVVGALAGVQRASRRLRLGVAPAALVWIAVGHGLQLRARTGTNKEQIRSSGTASRWRI